MVKACVYIDQTVKQYLINNRFRYFKYHDTLCLNQDYHSPIILIFSMTNNFRELMNRGILNEVLNTYITVLGDKGYTEVRFKEIVKLIDFESRKIIFNTKYPFRESSDIARLRDKLINVLDNYYKEIRRIKPDDITLDSDISVLGRFSSSVNRYADISMFNGIKVYNINHIKDLVYKDKNGKYQPKDPIAPGIGEVRRLRLVSYLRQANIIEVV